MSGALMGWVAVLCGGMFGDVQLPASSTAEPVKDTEFFEVTVDASGAMSVGGEAKSLGECQVAFAIWRQMVKGSDEEGGFCAHPLRIRADQRAEAKDLSIRLGPRKMDDLQALKNTLQKAFKFNPKARVTLYPHSGVLIVDLYKVLGLTTQAGFQLPGIAGNPKES